MTKLAEYLSDNGLTQGQFADIIGVDVSVVSRFARGLARPGIDLADKIEIVTGGAVPMKSWVKSKFHNFSGGDTVPNLQPTESHTPANLPADL